MFEDIPLGSLLDGFGTVAVVVLIGWMVFTGRLVPRRYYDDVVQQRDLWEGSAKVSEQQVRNLIEQGDLTLELLKSLDRQARKGGQPE